jgi:hypothetical protein
VPHQAKEIVHERLALEATLFKDRFNGSFTGDLEHFERWKARHQRVLQALAEWKDAVDSYLAASNDSE